MFTTDEFAYFAYGSNMSARRLVARVPSARVVASGFVSGCRLAFDKISNDGSGKCDCESTGVAGDRVYGVIFGVAFRDRVVLDRFEGAGAGYEPKTVHVETNVCGLDALTYFATKKRFGLTPYHWYKRHVLIGAREAGLPADYIRAIEAVASVDDSQQSRAEKEARLYD
ncbi:MULTISPECIES: gamma-glutamylcyclotransferase family protein [Paraburkholderia]|uniref:Gamma-glutamylcyclotransferase n=1 Tax=Paraburkholderia madseniana TaxID=2599607 RepID=A0AAP5BCR3_9BURK|nr:MULTISPECIES: gamma-glutamylcyclotransferase family protein [Paraburkholderia]MCX4147090.1 gamma-glutamylcyclotransferase [Paraburkholderia madseniana]MDN7150033.1 gamma-glutamylcyclotransferase [Paraburkholderia sp. WS6]MDQ6408913.1 gamma-glutamylcyclotransferase [Paraburkholderia madseniana]